ncbi:Hypothetical protein HVR_LOCUS262 [uncultured virus]|nr:Hypothetical protein HVR_LOCUS262 [uncultured virus]
MSDRPTINITSPWFECLVYGSKVTIPQVNIPPWSDLKYGKLVNIQHVTDDETELDGFVTVVVENTFECRDIFEFIDRTTFSLSLPGVTDLDLAIRIYKDFLISNKEEIRIHGIIGLHVET